MEMEMKPKDQLKRKISEELKTKEQIAKMSFDVEELRCQQKKEKETEDETGDCSSS